MAFEAGGTTIRHIYITKLVKKPVAFPPAREQESISTYVNHFRPVLDSTIERVRREIDCVREYRTRLIADVVTGKLDVRRVELPPLEEAEEPSVVGDEIAEEVTGEVDELEPVEDTADAGD
jgi:type I restriction enzyme S subunit